MLSVLQELADRLTQGDTVALATVVRTRGSVPQQIGAKMVIHPLGRHAGTIGGGCGEAAVMTAAIDVIQTGNPALVAVDLTGEITDDNAAVCGGLMDVFVERVPSPMFDLPVLQQAIDSMDRGEPAALVSVILAPSGADCKSGDKTVISDASRLVDWIGADLMSRAQVECVQEAFSSRKPQLTDGWFQGHLRPDAGQLLLFIEPLRRPPHLVIAGAGHIAVPLAHMGHLCGFRTTVIDDRAKFANAQRFPDVDSVIAADMAATLRSMHLDLDSYVVLVTRGHQHDVECLVEVVDKPLAYLGLIGSRRRVGGVFEMLQRDVSIPQALLDQVHSPIGLDIGAKTPAEIAVAIMAEVISAYRGGRLDR